MTRPLSARIPARDLIHWTPFRNPPLPYHILGLSIAFYVVPSTALFFILYAVWSPLSSLLAVAFCALGLWKDRPETQIKLANDLELNTIADRWEYITQQGGPPGSKKQISSLAPSAWVCNKDEHDEKCKQNRRENGRAAPDPPVNYRLAIATLLVNGAHKSIAFSDGNVVDWHPASHGLERDFIPPRSHGYLVTDRATLHNQERVLNELIERTVKSNADTSLDTILGGFDSEQREDVYQAVHTSLMWGLLRVTKQPDASGSIHAIRSLHASSPSGSGAIIVRITPAGKLWRECSEERTAARERSARMRESGPNFKFYKGSTVGNINYSEGDIIGQTTVVNQQPPPAEVLEALEAVLRRSDVPWDEPDLQGIRATIQQAVRQQDVSQEELRPAVGRLLKVLEAVGFGVVGNTVYDVLKAFVF
jgi:hypothetical protein